MGNRGSFPGVKRPGRETDHSLPSSVEVKECVELYLHSPNTPSWRGAKFKAQGQIYLLKVRLGRNMYSILGVHFNLNFFKDI
jgi:hypothetical protein